MTPAFRPPSSSTEAGDIVEPAASSETVAVSTSSSVVEWPDNRTASPPSRPAVESRPEFDCRNSTAGIVADAGLDSGTAGSNPTPVAAVGLWSLILMKGPAVGCKAEDNSVWAL